MSIHYSFREENPTKIYGPFCDRGEWRIRWNQELYDIYDDIDVVKRIKIQRLRGLGHVSRMDSSNQVRKVFESEAGGGCRRKGRVGLNRWMRMLQRWASEISAKLQQCVVYSVAKNLRPRPVAR